MRRRLNWKLLIVLIFVVGMGSVGLFLGHRWQVRKAAARLLNQAAEAEKRGDTEKTVEFLRRYLGFVPEDSKNLEHLGVLLAMRANSADAKREALVILDRASRLRTPSSEIRLIIVKLAMDPQVARYEDASVYLRDMLKAQPNDAELEEKLAQCLQALNRGEEAIEQYRLSLEHDSSRLSTYVKLARLLRTVNQQTGEADRVMDARKDRDGIIVHNPQVARAYLERGTYRRDFRIDGADRDVAKALELQPEDPDVLLAAVEMAIDAGNGAAASDHLDHAEKLAPGDVRVYLSRARVALQAGDRAAADAALLRGLEVITEVGPRSLLFWERAGILIMEGRLDEAEEIITRLKDDGAQAEMLELLRARVLIGREEWSRAISMLESARGKLIGEPRRVYEIELLLAECHQRLGDTDRQLSAYRRAADVLPSPVPARLGLAATLAELQRFDEALTRYRQLVTEVPGLRTTLARLLIDRNRQLPEARRQWEEVDRILIEAERERPGAADVALVRAEALQARDRVREARNIIATALGREPANFELATALGRLSARETSGSGVETPSRIEALKREFGDTPAFRLAAITFWSDVGGPRAKEALATLEMGLDVFSAKEQAALRRALATAHVRNEDFNAARRTLDQLRAEEPNDFALLLTRHELARRAFDVPDIATTRTQVVQLLDKRPPKSLPPLLGLFDLAMQADDDPLASRALDVLRKVEGEDGAFWRQARARWLIRQVRRAPADPTRDERLAHARDLLGEAGQRRPTWPLVPIALADLEKLNGQPENVIRHLERAKELGSRDPAVFLELHRLYIAIGRADLAQAQARQMQALGSLEAALGTRLIAEDRLRQLDAVQALAEARQAVPKGSKDFRDHLWLVPFLIAANRPSEAETELREAVALGGPEPAPWVALVQFLARSGRQGEAVAATSKAATVISPDRAAQALAECHMAMGDPTQARSLLLDGLKERPEDPVLLSAAADLALGTGNLTETESYLKRLGALKQVSGDTAIWAQRTRALVLAMRNSPTSRKEARALIGLEDNADSIQPNPATPTDLVRAYAQVLAAHPETPYRRAATRLLEHLLKREAGGTEEDHILLAGLEEGLGDWPKARGRLQRLVEINRNPNDTSHLVRFLRGLLETRPQQDPEDVKLAGRWLPQLEKTAPNALITIELKARYLKARGERPKAVELLQGFADEHTDQAARVAALLESIGTAGDAEPVYRRLVNTSGPSNVLLLARFLERAGRPDDAEPFYVRHAETAAKEGFAPILELAAFHGRHGRVAKAIELCQRAWSLAPAETAANILISALMDGQPTDAELQTATKDLQSALQRSQDNPVLLFQLSNVALLDKKFDLAEQLLRQSVERNNDLAAPFNNLAWVLALKTTTSPSEPLRLIERAIALDGALPELIDTKALVDARRGLAQQAVRDLREIIDQAMYADPLWWFHLARVHAEANQPREAAEAFANGQKAGLTRDLVPLIERSGYDQLVNSLKAGRS